MIVRILPSLHQYTRQVGEPASYLIEDQAGQRRTIHRTIGRIGEAGSHAQHG